MQETTSAPVPAGPSDQGGTIQPEAAPTFQAMAQEFALDLLGVVVLLAVTWVAAGWARRALRRALERAKFDATLGRFAANALRWTILILAMVACLEIFGIKMTSFAAIVGAAALAIGLAFQGSLSNLASGVMLLIFRPFKVGDVIGVAGQLGTVNEIDLFMTEIDTPDGRRVILPNGQIFGNTIENITHHPRRRVEVLVGVAYEADIDQTRAVLERAILSVSPRLETPASDVVLQDLGASSVNWAVRIWTRRENYGATRQAAVRAIKLALDAAGIGIPYPQMDVAIRSLPAERAQRGVLDVFAADGASGVGVAENGKG